MILTVHDRVMATAIKYQEKLRQPHLQCERATEELLLLLREHGILLQRKEFIVDMKHYNGINDESKFKEIKHVCIKFGSKILDVTANQFNDTQGRIMPAIYFGPTPIWYKQ